MPSGSSLLDEIVREGARRVLAAALEAEVNTCIAELAEERDEQGHRGVVRNGYHLSSGDFVPALEQYLSSSAGLSAAPVTRLTTQWQADHAVFVDRGLFTLVESAPHRWQAVNAPHLVTGVRAGARIERGRLVERPEAVAA